MSEKLPEIRKGDLVLLQANGFWKLFYSDGRVASTKLIYDDLKSELANVDIPKGVLEELRAQTDPKDPMADEYVADKLRRYRQNHLIEKAISNGHLEEFLVGFGRDSDRGEYWKIGLENAILHYGPLAIFGYTDEVTVMWTRYELEFDGKHVIYAPSFRNFSFIPLLETEQKRQAKKQHITISKNMLPMNIVVGNKAIREGLEGSVAKGLLETGLIPEE